LPRLRTNGGIVGILSIAEKQLDVRYLDFPRPRPELVELLGERNQSCPVVLREAPRSLPASIPVQQSKGHWFIEGANDIAAYLAHVHGVGIPH
jgi:hypothetical protein